MDRNLKRLKTSKERKIYGLCTICGDRVRESHQYIIASEGYCHQKCLDQTEILA